MPSILIVCTANQCRSPMAMVLLRKHVQDLGLDEEWRVDSAGTWAEEGVPATDNAVLTMEERGLNIAEHRSRKVTREMMLAYDLVLVMVSNHKEALHVEFPDQAHKVFLMSEMVGEDWDVDDPIGMPMEEYRATAEMIERIIKEGWGRIVELGSEGGPSP